MVPGDLYVSPSQSQCTSHCLLNLHCRRMGYTVRVVKKIEKRKIRNMIENMHNSGVPVSV